MDNYTPKSLLFLSLLLPLLIGCGEEPVVREYTEHSQLAPKPFRMESEQAPKAPFMNGGMGSMTDLKGKSILGAILEAESFTYFFKMTGAKDQLKKYSSTFTAFCKSIRLNPELSWKAPAGFDEQKATGMRLATIKNADVEISITRLSGNAGGMKSNIVRWMGQVSLKDKSDKAYQTFIAKQKTVKSQDGKTIQLVDLSDFP